ncbi:MAG: helix-turn-helix domain-containing protein [Pseudomonadota bacterium]
MKTEHTFPKRGIRQHIGDGKNQQVGESISSPPLSCPPSAREHAIGLSEDSAGTENSRVIEVGLLLDDGFSARSLSELIHLFKSANTLLGTRSQPIFEWSYVGDRPGRWIANSGLKVVADRVLHDLDGLDVLFVVGGPGAPDKLEGATASLEKISMLSSSCRIVVTGSAIELLARTGMLDGHNAATPPWLYDEAHERFPKVNFLTDEEYAASGRYMTVATDKGLHIAVADLLQTGGNEHDAICFLAERQMETLKSVPHATELPLRALQVDPMVTSALVIMLYRFSEPIDVNVLADEVGTGRRQLERRFKRVTGKSPAQMLRFIRLGKARALVQGTDLLLKEIAYRTGFSGASHLTREYQREFAISPSIERAPKTGTA